MAKGIEYETNQKLDQEGCVISKTMWIHAMWEGIVGFRDEEEREREGRSSFLKIWIATGDASRRKYGQPKSSKR